MGGYKKYKGSQPDDPKSYVPQEISIFRDIDGNGVIEDTKTIKETGFDIDGMNYTLKSVIKNYDQLDSLQGTDKMKLQGKYENLNSAYSDDTTIKPSVSHDSNSYEKIKATLGRYDQYVDRISYEMKAVVELKWDSAVGKYKIVRYELLGE
jgi:septation ring formation regulator EzrA